MFRPAFDRTRGAGPVFFTNSSGPACRAAACLRAGRTGGRRQVWMQGRRAEGVPGYVERKVIAEAHRVLVPHGVYIIQGRFKRDDLADDSYGEAFKRDICGRGCVVFGIEEYKRILRETGFEIVTCEVDRVTPLCIEHDEAQCRPYCDRGDIPGAIIVARRRAD